MALTDEEIQQIQIDRKKNIVKDSGDLIKIGNKENRKYFTIINIKNETTQAIAFAPSDSKGKHIDYSQTSIVYLGTQVGLNESTKNAIDARGGLSPQYKDMESFYKDTATEVSKHNGKITNLSGYSQSGVPSVKIGAKYKVPKITTFVDWGSEGALKHGDFSKEELAYIRRHANCYSDSGKDLTYFDGGSGRIVYGNVMTAEGNSGINSPWGDHDPAFFHIKGNSLNIEWYIKNAKFATGMTEKQVRQVAKLKAKKAEGFDLFNWDTWGDKTDVEFYVNEYKKIYGPFALEISDQIKVNNKKISSLHQQLASASGTQTIQLREELVLAVAQNASAQATVFEAELKDQLEVAKETVSHKVAEVSQMAHSMAQFLTDAEVEQLLGEFSMDTCWDQAVEAENLAQAKAYSTRLSDLAGQLEAASAQLVDLDKGQAVAFDFHK